MASAMEVVNADGLSKLLNIKQTEAEKKARVFRLLDEGRIGSSNVVILCSTQM